MPLPGTDHKRAVPLVKASAVLREHGRQLIGRSGAIECHRGGICGSGLDCEIAEPLHPLKPKMNLLPIPYAEELNGHANRLKPLPD